MSSIRIIGCGWLGQPLAHALQKQGHAIIGSSRSPEKVQQLNNSGLHTLQLNTLEETTLPADFWQADVFFINIPPSRKDLNISPSYAQQIEWILKQIKTHQQTWTRVFFASSTGVYGQGKLLDEESPCQPERPSAKAVLAAEQVIKNHPSKNLKTTILRFAGLAGPKRAPGRFLAGKKGLKSGHKAVNLVHLQDCIQIITKLIEEQINTDILNICADEHPLQKDFYPAAARKLGLSPPEFEDSQGPARIISNKKLKALLNYSFLHPNPSEFPVD